jgi:hypothetical protein
MPREAVEATIGSPAKYAPAFQAGKPELGERGEMWFYETRRGLGGVAFILDVGASSLVRVHMHERYLWESGSARTVYELSAAGRLERAEFAKIMNCSA